MAGGGSGRVPAGATVLFTDLVAPGWPRKAVESAPVTVDATRARHPSARAGIHGETAEACTGAGRPFPVGTNRSRSAT